jgi:hypothetical protein
MCKFCKKHNELKVQPGAPLRAALAGDRHPLHDGTLLSHGNYHPHFAGHFPMTQKNDAVKQTERFNKHPPRRG